MASVAVAAESPLAEVNASKGVLVVHCPGGDEVYTMTDLPRADASLVEAEKKNILKGLELKSVFTNLNRASDLLFLAYMANWGTGDLQAGIALRQSELLELCTKCVETMDALRKASNGVQSELRETYSSLLEANETEAITNLATCSQLASTMSARCQKLADAFGTLKEKTVKGEVTAIEKLSEQIVEIEELEKKLVALEAKRSRPAALDGGANQSTQDAAKPQASARPRFKGFDLLPEPSEVPDAAKPQASGPGHAQLRASEAATAKAKGDVAEAEEEEAKAREEKKVVSRKVFEAQVDKTEKQAKFEKAKSALDASSANLEKLLDEQQRAKERLRRIKRKTKRKKEPAPDVSAGAAEASSSPPPSAKETTHAPGDGSKELATTRLQLVQLKIEKENQRRESLGKLAVVTSSLDINGGAGRSAKDALSIAAWAFTNIRLSLHNMQRFCEDLASPEELQKIRDQIQDDRKTKKQRLRFYKSQHFVPIAVTYICKWTAAISVFVDSAKASDEALQTVKGHIHTSPNLQEAQNLIGPLKSRLSHEFITEAVESDAVKEALVADKRIIEAGAAADA